MNFYIQNKYLIGFSLIFLLFLNACGKRKTFEKYNNLPALTWEQNNISKYNVTIAETPKNPLKMGVGLRVVPSIAHKAVPIQLSIKPKDNKLTPFVKNFQIHIKDDKGQIDGSVMGDLADVERTLEDFPFNQKGEYEVEIQHTNNTTQDKKILGIMEVGFFIN